MKRIWQEKRKAAGKSIHEPGPNIVMGANAQVALEKFARYFEVETRLVPISVASKYRLDPKKAMEYIDENTIGVYVILGSMNALSSRFMLPSMFTHRYIHWSLRTGEGDGRFARRVREEDGQLRSYPR